MKSSLIIMEIKKQLPYQNDIARRVVINYGTEIEDDEFILHSGSACKLKQ